ncbi:MAG: AtpZ/AtpI family protein [Candidatus Acidiferrales bacterium]
MTSQPPIPPKRSKQDVTQLAMVMELPMIMIGAVVIGGGLGYLLDQRLHTSPTFALILGLLGFGAGVWEIIRRLSRSEKSGSGSA